MIVSAGPGRLSTLTNEQEQKLKEMWAVFLTYCNVIKPDQVQSQPAAAKPVSTASSAKPAKAKRGWFSRKSTEPDLVDADNSKPGPSPSSTFSNSTSSGSLPAITAFATAIRKHPGDQVLQSLTHMCRADNPDSLFLRFLRARKWNVEHALAMMGSTLHWRMAEGHPDSLLATGEIGAIAADNDGLMDQLRIGKAQIHGYDLCGRPVVHVYPHLHDPKTSSLKAVQDFTVFIIENARLCLKEPVDTACVFFDMSQFSLANMDHGAVKFIIQCFEGHYPESLGRLLIFKAPWVFSGIWSMIKGWLDPVVANKIVFVKTYDDLANYFSDDLIPKSVGGTNEFVYKYVEPTEEESSKMKDLETKKKHVDQQQHLMDEYVKETVKWIEAGTDEAATKTTREKKLAIAKEMYKVYWEADEYIRARSIIDRTGELDVFAKLHKEWTVKQGEME